MTDPSGAAIQNAKVLVESKAIGLRRFATTSASGTFTIPALPIGLYQAEVSANGFRTRRIEEFPLQVGQTLTLDAPLQVAGTDTTVEVAAESPLAQTNAAIAGVISGTQIQNLPVNGRNWASLMSLAPGAIDTGQNDQRSVRFAGRGLDDNNYRFDGVDATGIQNQAQRTSTRLQISTEAIAEFRASSGLYSAETGGTSGGQIEIVSKTGTNQIHGSVFEFLRNDIFDARSFDARTSSPPAFRLNQFGGSIGGAIWKDHTFFFANYEGLRQTLGQTLTGVVPSESFRAATLAKSPSLKPILDAYPAGSVRTSDANVDTWFGSGRQTVVEDAGMGRIDHRFDDKTSAFLRFNMDVAVSAAPIGGNGFLRDRLANNIKPYNAILSVQRVISPTQLNDFKLGFNRSDFFSVQESVLPFAVTVPSFSTLNNGIVKIAASNSFSVLDNFSWTLGRHSLKAGIEIKRVQVNQSATASDDLTVAFSSAANFQNNIASGATLNATVPLGGLRKTSYFGYFQDEMKLKPNLTVSLGLRYEYFGLFHEVLDRAIVFDPKTCPATGFCPKGSDFYFPPLLSFSPRVSVAWSPQMFKGKTVIRSGYGNFYGEAQLGDLNAPINNIAVRLALTNANTPGLSYPVAPYLASAANSLTPRGLDRTRKNQNIAQWGLSVQQELLRGTVFEVGYLGTKGTHLFTRSGANLFDPILGRRPYPSLGQVDYKTADSNSTFHAMQLSLRRNYRAGFVLTANYQWAHSINDGSVGGGEALAPENINCRACERGSSDQDIRQVLTGSAVWTLPVGRGKRIGDYRGFAGVLVSGWELSGIGTARTGRPVNILVTRAATALPDQNNANQRPNAVVGVSQFATNQTVQSWLNPAAYAVPAAGVWGNLGKNTARGPGLWQIDPALTKMTRFNERLSLNFRFEVFNVFNRAQYGDPVNSISNAAQFGQITGPVNTTATGSGTPRQMQLMLRLSF